MNIVKGEFTLEFYEALTKEQRSNIKVMGEDVPDVDYSHDDIWIDLKYKAKRAYKKQKEREHKIRQDYNG